MFDTTRTDEHHDERYEDGVIDLGFIEYDEAWAVHEAAMREHDRLIEEEWLKARDQMDAVIGILFPEIEL